MGGEKTNEVLIHATAWINLKNVILGQPEGKGQILYDSNV